MTFSGVDLVVCASVLDACILMSIWSGVKWALQAFAVSHVCLVMAVWALQREARSILLECLVVQANLGSAVESVVNWSSPLRAFLTSTVWKEYFIRSAVRHGTVVTILGWDCVLWAWSPDTVVSQEVAL